MVLAMKILGGGPLVDCFPVVPMAKGGDTIGEGVAVTYTDCVGT